MKVLFFGLPVHGHMNPTFPLVRELVRRGDDVVFFSTDEFASRIEATGAAYRPYKNAFLPELGSIARRMDELVWLFMRTTAEVLEEELESFRAEKPDCVITDSVAPWGQWVGRDPRRARGDVGDDVRDQQARAALRSSLTACARAAAACSCRSCAT